MTNLLLLLACSGKGSDSAVDPHDLDSDKDSLNDWDEVHVYHTDPNNADSDGDGLNDGVEVNDYGTDPTITDTDGDGYDDKLEVDSLTDPTQQYSHPYIGDFNVGTCKKYPDKATAHPSGFRIVETGGGGAVTVALYEEGDTVKNFQLIDQYGEQVDLYSFCGKFVDILFFQFNQLSGPSEYAALSCWIQDFKNVHSYYRDYGYELIVVLTQNNDTALPTKEDVSSVATMMGFLDLPVLASNDETIGSFHSWFEKDFHEPTLVHIGPELNVLSVDKDDCAGSDRDPCPYMGDWVPKGQCWHNPDDTCAPLDTSNPNQAYCACPYPDCKKYEWYCKKWGLTCNTTWED
jgi:hypothetical protein